MKDPTSRIKRWVLRLQEYDWDIEYRPGTQIAHADALSRAAINVLCWDRFVHMMPEEFGKEQWKDRDLRKFMRYLKDGWLPKDDKLAKESLWKAS